MSQAFEITSTVIATVLRKNWSRVANSHGMSFDAMAEQMMDALDLDAIESSALDAGTDVGEQMDSAHTEIEKQLVERGVLMGACTTHSAGQLGSHQSMSASCHV